MSLNDLTKFTAGKKMNFSQTCNMLSQLVKDKQKRALQLTHGISSEGYDRSSTMNLSPVEDSNGSVGRTIDLFPQISGFNSSANTRASPEPSAGQMTIFYGGKVVVFNDLPSDKAKDVINLASSFESSLKKRKVCPIPFSVPNSIPNQNSNVKQNPSPNPNRSVIQNPSPNPNFVSNVMPAAAALPQAFVPNADLPIARKASLHRFLEKRKERLVGKTILSANVSDGTATKPSEGKAWLGLNSLPVFQQKQQQ